MAVNLGGAHGNVLGRQGLSCESVLRCAVFRHLHQLSCRGLEARTQRDAARRKRTYRNLFRLALLTLDHVDSARPRVAALRSPCWVYDQLKRFRAGVEAGISFLKRCFGLARCRWRGLPRFRAWIHSVVFTRNLVQLARLHPT